MDGRKQGAAFILLGGATAAVGLLEDISVLLCSPRPPPSPSPGCIPVAGLSLYGLALVTAAPIAGLAMLTLGLVLHRQATIR